MSEFAATLLASVAALLIEKLVAHLVRGLLAARA
jgi:hypothetical protein